MGGTDHRQCGRMPDHQSYRSGRRNWGLTSVGPPDALWADPAVLCAFASGQAIDPDPGAARWLVSFAKPPGKPQSNGVIRVIRDGDRGVREILCGANFRVSRLSPV